MAQGSVGIQSSSTVILLSQVYSSIEVDHIHIFTFPFVSVYFYKYNETVYNTDVAL